LALTRRGKIVTGVTGLAVAVVAAILAFAFTGSANPIVAAKKILTDEPSTCPLTGREPAEGRQAPVTPLLAIKVENTPDAYPLAGLDRADLVYEETVEGGITRFVAIFQCQGADRVGPVRSARTTDPKILVQFQAHPILGYSGGAPQVVRAVDDAGVIGITENDAGAFTRDEARAMPHNLFTSTQALFQAAEGSIEGEGPPRPAFTYDEDAPAGGKRVSSASIDFPMVSAEWRWQGGRWVRYLDGAPMQLENGRPITATNVVIQRVSTTESDIIDAAGFPSPEVALTGTGRAWILRDGRLISGRWERQAETDLTTFLTKDGTEISLAPGTTWIELAPRGMFDAAVTTET
jgi:DUF3048 family protein